MSTTTLSYSQSTHIVRLPLLAIGAGVLVLEELFLLLLAAWVFGWQDQVLGRLPLVWRSVALFAPTVATSLVLLVAVVILCQVLQRADGTGRWKALLCMMLGIGSTALDMAGATLVGRWYYLTSIGAPMAGNEWMLHAAQFISVSARLLATLLTVAGIAFLWQVGSRTASRALGLVVAIGLSLSLLTILWNLFTGGLRTVMGLRGVSLSAYERFFLIGDRIAWVGGSAVGLLTWGIIALLALAAARRHQDQAMIAGPSV